MIRERKEQEISFIIIDGYNLIGIYHRDLEAQRERLINTLVQYSRKKRHSITVVFDGWKEGSSTEGYSITGGVRIIYSRLGEKADSVIKRIISNDRREWIVVSSDRDIASFAWSVGSIPILSETFRSFIEKGEEDGGDSKEAVVFEGDGSDEMRQGAAKRKGNPWRPSKRERAIKRALCKL